MSANCYLPEEVVWRCHPAPEVNDAWNSSTVSCFLRWVSRYHHWVSLVSPVCVWHCVYYTHLYVSTVCTVREEIQNLLEEVAFFFHERSFIFFLPHNLLIKDTLQHQLLTPVVIHTQYLLWDGRAQHVTVQSQSHCSWWVVRGSCCSASPGEEEREYVNQYEMVSLNSLANASRFTCFSFGASKGLFYWCCTHHTQYVCMYSVSMLLLPLWAVSQW